MFIFILPGMFGASGNINMPQFSQLFAFINQWTEAFKRADADKSGSIAQHELQNGGNFLVIFSWNIIFKI